MADPEGNEFCLTQYYDRRPATEASAANARGVG